MRIDTRAARAVPGVNAVLTGADIGDVRHGRRSLDWPVLALDIVRFIGDRVAAVAAERARPRKARRALIEVEYEELPAVLDPLRRARRRRAGAPSRSRRRTRSASQDARRARRHPNIQGGNVIRKGRRPSSTRAFARAHRVFEHSLRDAASALRLPRTALDAGVDRRRRHDARRDAEQGAVPAARASGAR